MARKKPPRPPTSTDPLDSTWSPARHAFVNALDELELAVSGRHGPPPRSAAEQRAAEEKILATALDVALVGRHPDLVAILGPAPADALRLLRARRTS